MKACVDGGTTVASVAELSGAGSQDA
jgi:hypothetical protein